MPPVPMFKSVSAAIQHRPHDGLEGDHAISLYYSRGPVTQGKISAEAFFRSSMKTDSLHIIYFL
jgi:hypothetical protein